jgi:hypothetical protein
VNEAKDTRFCLTYSFLWKFPGTAKRQKSKAESLAKKTELILRRRRRRFFLEDRAQSPLVEAQVESVLLPELDHLSFPIFLI